MNLKKFNKINGTSGIRAKKKVQEVAEYVVDHYYTQDGKPIIGEARDKVVVMVRDNMAFGSVWTRKEYLAAGVIGGVVLTVGSFVTYKLIKRRKRPQK